MSLALRAGFDHTMTRKKNEEGWNFLLLHIARVNHPCIPVIIARKLAVFACAACGTIIRILVHDNAAAAGLKLMLKLTLF